MSRKQIYRFTIVGILNTIVGYGTFFLLLHFNLYYVFALLISHIVGVTHSFIWNKIWTFKSKGNLKIEFLRFISVYGVVFVVNLMILALIVEKLMFDPRIGQIFALGIITIISFFGHKYFSFRV